MTKSIKFDGLVTTYPCRIILSHPRSTQLRKQEVNKEEVAAIRSPSLYSGTHIPGGWTYQLFRRGCTLIPLILLKFIYTNIKITWCACVHVPDDLFGTLAFSGAKRVYPRQYFSLLAHCKGKRGSEIYYITSWRVAR